MVFTREYGKESIDTKIVFNVSSGLDNFSQRNNEYVKIRGQNVVKPGTECNVTSICMAASYAGWTFPTIPHPELKQPEDRLAAFCNEDSRVSDYYKKINYNYWKEWQDGVKDSYPPNEIHDVLAYASCLWFGNPEFDKFSLSTPISDILERIWRNNLPIVLSGALPSNSQRIGVLNHIVTLVGLKYPEYKVSKSLEDPDPVLLSKAEPTEVIIDDPYGNPVLGYDKGLSGNDIVIPWNDFIAWFKPLKNVSVKWAHRIKIAPATV